ncbi:AAA family ATPase [Metarhizium album ARSEF 1941]|uniref:AAA family ATPase n=1 Tax=Metarhizium album (strain ARSEF 1941) TaxID=1081103 RepID=A0A0B2X5R7_METAS|nr:AAA family ATPase [Metarhizium album ARSEF 1941]KHO01113.1 AAA family ATPase [Metarhizium album ARSEF 1941]
MLRNKVFTALQKTYDDSYLSCSTAVYYESQGDELEALRHWRHGLEQIYEHQATKAIPGYEPQTDTEKALVEALNQLELQCKERLDLLEALRVSRQEGSSMPPATSICKTSTSDDDRNRNHPKGSIGQGTIRAVTYSELSRPILSSRPALPPRISSDQATPSMPYGGDQNVEANPRLSTNARSHSPTLPSKTDRTLRSNSPEKHTMRTTLRSGRANDKLSRPAGRSPKPVAEGPSKAATLAWSALGSRERLHRLPSDSSSSTSHLTARPTSDQTILASSPLQWDSHSRRLVTQRDAETYPNGLQSISASRHSGEYSQSKPSLLSVSAASSALNALSYQEAPFSDPASNKNPERISPARMAATFSQSTRSSGSEQPTNIFPAGDSEDTAEKRNLSDSAVRRKEIVKRQTQPSRPLSKTSSLNRENASHQVKKQAKDGSSDSDSPMAQPFFEPRRDKRKGFSVKMGAQSQSSEDTDIDNNSTAKAREKKATILKHLPSSIDEGAAKQILNDIVVQGDEVHWGDIAGLEIAKNALRETVVYPFLRPDLFMGLREPARGMLLFGPPGTGKTMLARAVATESKSTFFSISASSLTSKYLGESEKLVRALFGLARVLAPSIIFVDEIDSLLSQRSGSGEHEATRRIKTEFLIQWSDLQRAAAGRETTEKDKERGDANRVLVLAATNLPWAIDEAARRRFVRRQYIPLPEPRTRETQLRTLLGQQKHGLSESDIEILVRLTDGFSGSDITALAKDAAMGPLRSLGEALLHMTMDDIRPILLVDFEASLSTIRPSVSKAGLKEYEDWAKEFGERGG